MVTQAYTITVDEPANPSLAIFFDDQADQCSAGTEAWTTLDCYVFIMLEGGEIGCTRACEFTLRLTDSDDVDLEPGTDHLVLNTTYPDYVAVSMGNVFSGIAVSFNRPMFAYEGPVHVCTFGLMLIENLDQLSFKFAPNAGDEGILGVATCDAGYPRVEVDGRVSAINY
jgi:hypothetical protein